MTEQVDQQISIKFCVKLAFLHGNCLDDSEGFQGWCNECSTNKHEAQMLQRWSRICWKWSTFWKACNKQNTWECWMCMGCSLQRWATDSVKTRSWSGDSKNTVSEILTHDLGMKCVMAKFIPGFCYQSRRNIVLQLGELWGPKVPTLKGTEASLPYVQCFFFLVSSSVNVSIFLITQLDSFWTHFVRVRTHVCVNAYNELGI